MRGWPRFWQPWPARRAALGAALPARFARAWRAQKPAADGGAPEAIGARPTAALHPQPGLGRWTTVAGIGIRGGSAGGRGARLGGAQRPPVQPAGPDPTPTAFERNSGALGVRAGPPDRKSTRLNSS